MIETAHEYRGAPLGMTAAVILAAALPIAACRPSLDGGPAIGSATILEESDGLTNANTGWAMAESAALVFGGELLSWPGYSTQGWYPVTLPSTVLAGLAAYGIYGDLYKGTKLQSVDWSRFSGSWWYRMEFVAPESFRGQRVFLHLDRINYRANVWLDRTLIASADQVAGTFRVHELDVSDVIVPGAHNALAIEVFPPQLDEDLAISWIDWNPPAPDANMGIPGKVYFSHTGLVTLRFPSVTSSLDLPSRSSAAMTVRAEIANNASVPVTATVTGTIEAVTFSQDVSLGPLETKEVLFAPGSFPQLVLQGPRVWWPAQMGSQEMYQLSLTANVGEEPSSRAALSFGIRTVASELTDSGHLVFRINGKRILIRGAGWSSDLLLRSDPGRLESEITYVKHLGLNAIRLEGHLEPDLFFELCDRLGILVLAGWQCCDAWQGWDRWGPEQLTIAGRSMVDQARRLRNHPSVIDFLIGSDAAPPLDVERMFVQSPQENNWPNPISPSAAGIETPLLGASGLKMTGPYQWVAPSYWYLDTQGGGAFGFNTETGPGTAIPKLDSIKSMLDPLEEAALWNDGYVAQYHAGGGSYSDVSIFNEALTARYGPPADLEDYVLKAQVMQYESERALFEAFGRNKYEPATGVIHWKVNSAWPSLIWNLYGYDLVPAGAYFGVKKANEILHIQYSYDDRSVVVVNDGPRAVTGLHARASIHDLDGSERFSADAPLDMPEDGVQRVLVLPDIANPSPTYFVKLSLDDSTGRTVSDNFYWLSNTLEVIDWSNDRWYAPATLQFADFTALGQLPMTSISATAYGSRDTDRGQVRVDLANNSPTVAFFLQLELKRGENGPEVAPVLWEDNDFSLMPGETRSTVVSYRVADLGGAEPALRLSGWNVPRTSVPLTSGAVAIAR